ncbi:MAG TPA: trypsin-like peptidase domain-containing protein [Nitriliruptorales bacterium]|nr:trypsin-like peptidase domain-containing protein [Nitriliruptorales bacterium]
MDERERRPRWSAAGDPEAGSPAAGLGAHTVGHDQPTRPAAPLPPPSTWGAAHDGPGSPPGSVRPPDTTGTTTAPESTGGSRGTAGTLLAAMVGAVLGSAATIALSQTAAPPTGVPAAPPVQAPVIESQGGDSDQRTAVQTVAEAVIPSVVRIDRLLVADGVPEAEGLGSGVIYRSDGYIVTNNHVVEGAEQLEVRFSDSESYGAEVVGTDPLTDLAVLKVERSDLPAINVRAGSPDVGELAVAIGSPFGLDATVTAGVVSALNRSIEVPIGDTPQEGFVPITDVVQTDAAINPGNSGGALVDARGRLIGINSVILSTVGATAPSGGNLGVGFAISSDTVVAVTDKLISEGTVRHARLGISGGDVTAAAAREFSLDVRTGALVAAVEPGGPAADAGLQPGDVIVEVAGERVETFDELVDEIRRREPGDRLQLTILRDGRRAQVEAVLGAFGES